jgi:hypothetical protein
MATKVIDIAADRRVVSTSPLALGVFFIAYIITTLLMDLSLIYLILLAIEFFLSQAFFQYSQRTVFLFMFDWLPMATQLTPTIPDKQRKLDIRKFESIEKILHQSEIERLK